MQDDQVDKKNIKIEIDLSKNKKTISKDSKGNPLIYSLEISSNVKVLEDENLVLKKIIRKKFKYNNKSDIFELYRYEEKVEKNNESQEAKEKKEQKPLQVETSKVEKADAKESEISIEEKVEEPEVSKVSKEESEAPKVEEEKTDKTKKI